MTEQPSFAAGDRTHDCNHVAKCRGHCKIKSGDSVNEPYTVVLSASLSLVALSRASVGRMVQGAATPQAVHGEAQTS